MTSDLNNNALSFFNTKYLDLSGFFLEREREREREREMRRRIP
jgi:hypothetical protein